MDEYFLGSDESFALLLRTIVSMSTVDTDKLEAVVASLQNAISILPTGGTSIGEGEMISAGVRQLEFLDSYYNEMANSKAENTDEQTDGKLSAQEQYEQQQLAESEKMADEIQQELDNSQLSGKVDVDFNAEYVKLNLNGSILFASGKADLVKQAVPIVNKLGKILEKYNKNVIEIEGHTDNVPIRYSAKYENNEVLSVYRALAVTDQLRKIKISIPSTLSLREEEITYRLLTTVRQRDVHKTDA